MDEEEALELVESGCVYVFTGEVQPDLFLGRTPSLLDLCEKAKEWNINIKILDWLEVDDLTFVRIKYKRVFLFKDTISTGVK
jgi:hypothetical protein